MISAIAGFPSLAADLRDRIGGGGWLKAGIELAGEFQQFRGDSAHGPSLPTTGRYAS
jgi:hypothetical protein